MPDWLVNFSEYWWVGVLSLGTFIGSLAALPVIVIQIPTDYFAHEHRHLFERGRRHWLLHIILMILKNCLGVILLVAGIAMLALPGQGLLTLLMGLLLLDFPGKYALERRVIGHAKVFKLINLLRTRLNHEPLKPPQHRH